MSAEVIHGDCLEVMRQFPDGHFDALISDPPYGTTARAFDQRSIDWPAFWAQALGYVLQPPPPPFTTSTLQQEAARKLGFSASHTMRVAQTLYEAGAIT